MKKYFYLMILFLLYGCNNKPIELGTEENELNSELIIVYINGAVNFEGVYQIEADKLLIDLINKAGGFSYDADISDINLARTLHSNEMIIIPRINDIEEEGASDNKLININTGSLAELKQIPYIGDSLALAIIEYRTTNGPFSSIKDITKVDGIKGGLFEKIKDYITI